MAQVRKKIADQITLLDQAIANEDGDEQEIEYWKGSRAALAACEAARGRIPYPSVKRLLAEQLTEEHPSFSREEERGFYNTYSEYQHLRAMDTWRGEDGFLILAGAYPIYYLDQDNSVYCPDCAREEELENSKPHAIIVFRITAGDTHLEGEPLWCEKCNEEIESASGDPDTEEE